MAFVFLSGVMVAVGAILLSDHLRELRGRRDSQLQQQFLPDVIHMLVVEETSLFTFSQGRTEFCDIVSEVDRLP